MLFDLVIYIFVNKHIYKHISEESYIDDIEHMI